MYVLNSLEKGLYSYYLILIARKWTTFFEYLPNGEENKPNLVFFMETKISSLKIVFLKKKKNKVGFDNLFLVDSKGISGALCLLWMNEDSVNNQNYSRRLIF
jgi:hypothetical protein